jgi:transposase
MTTYMGIDVAKRKHTAVVLDEQRQVVVKPFNLDNNQAGVAALLAQLAQLAAPVEIGLEATGHYWWALYEQLTTAGYTVRVLNPLQVHAYQGTDIRKRKTDEIDAVWIADFVRISQGEPPANKTETQLQVRQLARFRCNLVNQIGDAKRRVVGLLDRVFPEYETLFSDVFLVSSRRLLAEAVTAQEFADFDLEELALLLQQASRGRFDHRKAQQIQQTARQSIGVSFLADAARVEMRCLLEQITFLETQVTHVDETLTVLVADLPDYQFLRSIPGIGPVIAAILLGEIGDIRRFETLNQLVAYAGIDPVVYQSGQFQAEETKMSKRGSPYLRYALWLAAGNARLHDPELQAYYEKRRAEGKAHGTVMGALCRKVLARVYSVLKAQRTYVIR